MNKFIYSNYNLRAKQTLQDVLALEISEQKVEVSVNTA